jgi:hypothetical protein
VQSQDKQISTPEMQLVALVALDYLITLQALAFVMRLAAVDLSLLHLQDLSVLVADVREYRSAATEVKVM